MRKLFFLFLSWCFPAGPSRKTRKFIPFQVYEPAYADSDSMLKYQGKLARRGKKATFLPDMRYTWSRLYV
jgi:hypothetical protein